MENDRVTPSGLEVPLLIAHDFLDQSFCARVRAAMDRGNSDAAEIIGTAITPDDAVRRTRSVEIDTPLLAAVERRLDGIRAVIETSVGGRLGKT